MKFYWIRRNGMLLTSKPICETCANRKVSLFKHEANANLEMREEPKVTSGQCLHCSTYYGKPKATSPVTIHYKGADERHPF